MSELDPKTKEFILYLSDPLCPFVIRYNGVDKSHDRISWDKDGVNYNLDGVWKFWSEMKH